MRAALVSIMRRDELVLAIAAGEVTGARTLVALTQVRLLLSGGLLKAWTCVRLTCGRHQRARGPSKGAAVIRQWLNALNRNIPRGSRLPDGAKGPTMFKILGTKMAV